METPDKLNPDKSQAIVFKRGRKSSKENGAMATWSWKLPAILTIWVWDLVPLADSTKRSKNWLVRRIRQHLYSTNVLLTPKHTKEMFDELITPILCYASEVWGFHDAPDIERVQLKFCKTVLGVKSSVQNGEPDRTTMKYVRFVNLLVKNCTWWKITLYHEVLYECNTDGWNKRGKWLGRFFKSCAWTKRVWICLIATRCGRMWYFS